MARRKTIPAVSVDDAWRLVRGDDSGTAHLFPVGGGRCLCRAFAADEASPKRATRANMTARTRLDRERLDSAREYCPECRRLWESGWLAIPL